MDDFSLETYLIPKLLENKIDFRILNYKNGDPVSLMVLYAYHGFWNKICRVDARSAPGFTFSPSCYNVVWYSKTPASLVKLLPYSEVILEDSEPLAYINTGYARAHDLVRDIRKIIDFNFKGENKMDNALYKVTDIEFKSSPSQVDEITVRVNVLGSHCYIREDADRIKKAIESIRTHEDSIDALRYYKTDAISTYRLVQMFNKSEIKDVIFNNPATIVFWKDGTKTVVKAENEEFDPEKGLAMAITKKALGNGYDYYDTFKKYVGRYEKKQKKGDK